VDTLSDEDLERLNQLLDWRCFTVDRHGRRFGQAAWRGKRDTPQVIPDRRIVLLDERFHLADKSVTEIGCFEGVHTVGLLQCARHVTAVDARIENVVKTIVRSAFYGFHPTVFQHDVERDPTPPGLHADVVHHVGVLYHLMDPVRHLIDLGLLARVGVMLDTHVATDQEADQTYESDGGLFRYKRYREGGRQDVFSGMSDHAKWLTLDVIMDVLHGAKFGQVEVVETRQERNGLRALLFASR
jgi:tRNA (mo5U34)-methyltransferase